MSCPSLQPPPRCELSDGARVPPPVRLPAEPGWAMFLDLDGTLCAYRESPDAVRLDAAQRRLLDVLALRLGGALCVLSGRSNDDLDRVLWGVGIARRGEHGHGRGTRLPPAFREELHLAGQGMRALAARLERQGVWVEEKAASCAIHYRRAPHLAGGLVESMRTLAKRYPRLRLLEGQCVIELASPHADKGRALREMMDHAPFRGRIPVAVGDDLTDEDAFAAAAGLGGFGVSVGARNADAARYWLPDSAGVNAWLQGLADP